VAKFQGMVCLLELFVVRLAEGKIWGNHQIHKRKPSLPLVSDWNKRKPSKDAG
jgi:hypothetical protein